MSQIPEPIDFSRETNEGFTHNKSDAELVQELVERFNELVIYLDSISERL